MSDVVIRVENLSKYYRLGLIGSNTLREDVQRWWARLHGRPDPLLPIDMDDPRHRPGGDIWALRDVNLEVREGEILGIIGRNGAGKSTLLKIISAITAPTTGSVKMKGRVGSLLEVGTGFHPELTGRENVYLNGAILGMTRKEVTDKLDEIVAFSELEKFIDTPSKRYSSGMSVRLAFSVAAHLDPEILIVDEVLAVGDAAFQKKCIGKIGEVSAEGRTVLFVSHNMAAIRQLCPRAVLMQGGRVVEEGDSAVLVTDYLSGSAQSSADRSEVVFEDDPRRAVQLRRVRLLDERAGLAQTFDCDERVGLELLLQVNRRIAGMSGCLQVCTTDGTVVLVSESWDVGSNALGNLSPGAHRIAVHIPARTLAAGRYALDLHFTDAHGGSLDSPGVVCTFELTDLRAQQRGRRKGYFSTVLPWEVSPAGEGTSEEAKTERPTSYRLMQQNHY